MLEQNFLLACTRLTVLLVLMQQPSSSVVSLSSNLTDQQALLAFKSQAIGNSTFTNNWTESANFCDWMGVLCNKRHQRVIGLKLPNMELSGVISPYLGNLSFLIELNLIMNNFHGHIVPEFGRLLRLKSLILDYNHFGGQIPQSLQYCKEIQVISLFDNKLVGPVPEELTTLPRLQTLFLGKNNLTGTIPSSFGNLTTLEKLGMELNSLHGGIPDQMAYIPNLKTITLGSNHLTGPIPSNLFNLSSLYMVGLSLNSLSGDLQPYMGLGLPNLEILQLGVNQLSGKIPLHISNLSMLSELDLGSNQLSGTVPTSLGSLESLTVLNLEVNQLKLESNCGELDFITALTSLRSLQVLRFAHNSFDGVLPYSTGNLSSSLQEFDASSCQIKGHIPESIGALQNLFYLDLRWNSLSGIVPLTIKGLEKLQRLYLDSNRLEGSIPAEICLLNNLGEIFVENNQLSGPIPTCIGNLNLLQILVLGSNALNSTIPSSLWTLSNLIFLNLSFNMLTGGIDHIFGGQQKSLGGMDLSSNQLSGNLPRSLESFQSLIYLNLSHNAFRGSLPESFGKLITLDFMDLSNNNLSGSIPKSLEAITHLKQLNLSYNKLSGEIPIAGPFANLTAESFLENEELCGHIVSKPCKVHGTRKPGNINPILVYVLPSILAAALAFGVLLYMLKSYKRRNAQSSRRSGSILQGSDPKFFSYQELCRATDNFCEANLLGIGSFSSVYKGTLSNGEIVAVKLLNLQVEGAIKSFDAECKVIRTVRHRNLVKIISACTNLDLRALVLEYMSNGSLHKWLYSHNYCLNLLQRVSIMLDVALAVEYLHHGQAEPIVHCDLKPSNVLLDEDMVAHVGDFGIAKILAGNSASEQTNTLGTIGYIAPEYGADGIVSVKGDIYSYGIMILETFTRKTPTEEMFSGELSLRKWVSMSIPDQITEVVDQNLLGPKTGAVKRTLSAIFELGLECCQEIPEQRSDMKDVVIKLNKIRLQIFSDEIHG